VAIGVIARSLIESEKEELNQHLRLFVDSDQTSFAVCSESQIIHRSTLTSGAMMPIAPFQTANTLRIGTFYLDRSIPLKMSCAVYVLSKSAPPTWFQLEFGSLPEGIPSGDISSHLRPTIIRKGSERPKVAWEQATWQP
jgi:hypothetical protein